MDRAAHRSLLPPGDAHGEAPPGNAPAVALLLGLSPFPGALGGPAACAAASGAGAGESPLGQTGAVQSEPLKPPGRLMTQPMTVAPPPASRTNAALCETVRGSEFWLLFVGIFGVAGGGAVISSHLAYIVAAQLGPGRAAEAKQAKDALVSLFSVSNCLGRLLAGAASDALARHVTRPQLLCAASLGMAGAHAALLGASQLSSLVPVLYAAIVLGGFA